MKSFDKKGFDKMKKIIPVLLASLLFTCIPISAKDERVDVIVEVENGVDPTLCADIVSERFDSSELHYVYDTLMHGFSIQLDMSQYYMLNSFDFVLSTAISGTYETLSESEVEDYIKAPNSAVEIDKARECGLDGEKIVVAVLDSGFDVSHTAFSNTPNSVKITYDYIDSLMSDMKLSAVMGNVTASDVYVSDRIPFAYDYSGYDSDVSSDSNHGTHVAGIIGASYQNGGVEGIAPSCQLLFMKVFNDDGVTTDFSLIAALEDSVKLGADVINLSLGRYSGSANEQMIVGINNLFKRAEEYGCIVVCAAGNESYSASRGVSENQTLPPAVYTDYGTISYPASADYTLSVASVDSNAVWGDYFILGNEKIYYTDTNKASGVLHSGFVSKFSGSYQYVTVPGVGSDEDYSELNVKGKIVLVERGELTFVEKANIASSHGAVGMIVYNNVEDESIKLELTGAPVPAVGITKESGELLKSAKAKRIKFSKDYKVSGNQTSAWKLSDFSSYGTTPSLTLGVDICGVGGGVYSSITDGYGGLSGTSMASPQIAGVCALIMQNIGYGQLLSERVKTVKTIIMNTAEPVVQENGIEYSPRRQGAGLAKLGNALKSEVSITYNKNAKAELYDLLKDEFSFDVTLTNLTDIEKKVELSATLTSDGYTKLNDVYYSTLTAEADKYSEIIVNDTDINKYSENFEGYEIVLSPNEVRTVTLNFKLNPDYHTTLSEVFTNGYFVEGFVFCTTDTAEISMPYMGYVGDWSDSPILDYSPEYGISVFGGTYLITSVSGIYLEAGVNYFGDDNVRGTIAFSPDGNSAGDVLWLSTELLRNAVSGKLTVTNDSGQTVYELSLSSYQTKSEGVSTLRTPILGWDGSDGHNSKYKLPDGKYTMTYTFTLDYYNEVQTYAYNVILDTKVPNIETIFYDENSNILKLTASDNVELQYIKLSESDKDEFKAVEVVYSDSCTAEFDLSEYSHDSIYIEVVDKAYNSVVLNYSLFA